MKYVSKLILCTFWGWKLTGKFPKKRNQYIIIVAPHTSGVDFLVALLVRSITQISPYYFGKASLFKKPFGYFFRSLKGIPIDRSSNQNYVETIVQQFKDNPDFTLALSPEGTRKKVTHWKTGFYHIAHQAKVPIIKVSMDYSKKEICIDNPVMTSGNIESDMIKFKSYFDGVVGKHPQLS